MSAFQVQGIVPTSALPDWLVETVLSGPRRWRVVISTNPDTGLLASDAVIGDQLERMVYVAPVAALDKFCDAVGMCDTDSVSWRKAAAQARAELAGIAGRA